MDKAKKQALEEQSIPTHSELIYKGHILTLRIDTKRNERFERKREVVLHPGAVAILPIDAKGNLVLIKQWRHPIGKILIEIPAGILEKGEKPADAAQRELQEEIGYRARLLSSIGGLYPSPGFCNEYIHLFLAQDLEASHLPHDECEAIDLFVISLQEALEKIKSNEISDSKSIAAILYYQNFLKGSK